MKKILIFNKKKKKNKKKIFHFLEFLLLIIESGMQKPNLNILIRLSSSFYSNTND